MVRSATAAKAPLDALAPENFAKSSEPAAVEVPAGGEGWPAPVAAKAVSATAPTRSPAVVVHHFIIRCFDTIVRVLTLSLFRLLVLRSALCRRAITLKIEAENEGMVKGWGFFVRWLLA
jgi:hypothetical protein